MDSWIQIISSVGFPIFACCALGFYVYKVQTKLQEIVNENTRAIEKLIDKIEHINVK